jgi:predicted MFS family arabinose efflux permease
VSWPVELVNFMVVGFGFYLLHGCIQVYVTELAPTARGSAAAGHSAFFFLGQAVGPVVYGLGLASVGIVPVLLVGALVLAATGWVCALRMQRATAPT